MIFFCQRTLRNVLGKLTFSTAAHDTKANFGHIVIFSMEKVLEYVLYLSFLIFAIFHPNYIQVFFILKNANKRRSHFRSNEIDVNKCYVFLVWRMDFLHPTSVFLKWNFVVNKFSDLLRALYFFKCGFPFCVLYLLVTEQNDFISNLTDKASHFTRR